MPGIWRARRPTANRLKPVPHEFSAVLPRDDSRRPTLDVLSIQVVFAARITREGLSMNRIMAGALVAMTGAINH